MIIGMLEGFPESRLQEIANTYVHINQVRREMQIWECYRECCNLHLENSPPNLPIQRANEK